MVSFFRNIGNRNTAHEKNMKFPRNMSQKSFQPLHRTTAKVRLMKKENPVFSSDEIANNLRIETFTS